MRQILTGERIALIANIFRRTGSDNGPPVISCSRPHIDEEIARQHHSLIVFHYQNRISLLLQFAQRINETLIVARMETNGGFIQNVANANESRTNTRGESYPLQFTPTERIRRTIKCQIGNAYFFQKTQTTFNRPQDWLSDRFVLRINVNGFQKLNRFAYRQCTNFMNCFSTE